MTDKPQNKHRISNMWQELKRRRVFRVITTYAATAYIIIEVTNNIIEPLHLPEWTATLVILLLALGLPVAAILAWLFDITPEGVKRTEEVIYAQKKKSVSEAAKRGLRVNDIIIAVLLIIVVLLAYPKIFGRNKKEDIRSSDGRISVAVMPFLNMTNHPSLEDWQEGVQANLITSLSNYAELKVKQAVAVNKLIQERGLTKNDLIKQSVAGRISKKLDANVLICGTIKQAASIIRLNAQVINTISGNTLRSFQIDGTPVNILNITDSLSILIKNSLMISLLEEVTPYSLKNSESTSSTDAYSYFISGSNALFKFDYPTASKWYKMAVEADSNYTFAIILLSFASANQGLYKDAKIYCLKAWNKKEHMDIQNEIWTNYIYALLFKTPNDELMYLRQLKGLDSQIPIFYYFTGQTYNRIYEFEKAIPELEKALSIYQKTEIKPYWAPACAALGFAYHKSGQYNKEKKLYRKSAKYFPDDQNLTGRKAVLAFSEADTLKAEKYIREYLRLSKNNLKSEPDIATGVAEIYLEAGWLDKAEQSFRQALSQENDRPQRLSNLAWFLIDTGRDINEGLELIDKALKMDDQNYLYFDCKGWGLYKLGKYEEARKFIEKSWESRPVYDHRIYLHKLDISRQN